MKLTTLLSDERAVSPAIGVILMVAITVILAAVIGSFVFGLGQNVQSTPSASFDSDFDTSPDSVGVTRNDRDTLEEGENTGAVQMSGGDATEDWVSPGNESSISAGDPFGNYDHTAGDTVRVIRQDTNNESSATLGQQDAPS